jgi:hypothetical protein
MTQALYAHMNNKIKKKKEKKFGFQFCLLGNFEGYTKLAMLVIS